MFGQQGKYAYAVANANSLLLSLYFEIIGTVTRQECQKTFPLPFVHKNFPAKHFFYNFP